jgi:hypothetical protein
MKKQKLKRNKFFSGNKKLKNVKMFEDFGAKPVNEGGKIEIWADVQAVDECITILYLLIDEGHFDHHGFPKSSLEDVNDELEDAGYDKDYFKTDADMEQFTNTAKSAMQELIAKL